MPARPACSCLRPRDKHSTWPRVLCVSRVRGFNDYFSLLEFCRGKLWRSGAAKPPDQAEFRDHHQKLYVQVTIEVISDNGFSAQADSILLSPQAQFFDVLPPSWCDRYEGHMVT